MTEERNDWLEVEDWIEHTGDKCPVDEDTSIEIMVESGETAQGMGRHFSWNQGRAHGDTITKYRVL